jgi:cation diffusion facilitator CzcD-associated flavoprotein CzcO
MTEIPDVVVVGPGQAGLVMGHHLAKQGKRYTHGSADVQTATGGTR